LLLRRHYGFVNDIRGLQGTPFVSPSHRKSAISSKKTGREITLFLQKN
jgi:hypothetical protein